MSFSLFKKPLFFPSQPAVPQVAAGLAVVLVIGAAYFGV